MRSFNLAPAPIPIMLPNSNYAPQFQLCLQTLPLLALANVPHILPNFAPQFSPITNVPRSLNPAPVIISHVIICLPAPAIAIAIACACQCLSLFLISYSPNFPRSPKFPRCSTMFVTPPQHSPQYTIVCQCLLPMFTRDVSSIASNPSPDVSNPFLDVSNPFS